MQLGAALAERGIAPVDDLAGFLRDQLDPTAEHVRLWQIARAAASDALTLQAGRKVGAALVREAIETALSEPQPSWKWRWTPPPWRIWRTSRGASDARWGWLALSLRRTAVP